MNAKLLLFLTCILIPSMGIGGEAQEGLVPMQWQIHEPTGEVLGLAVVAPGAGYDMDQPLITRIADEAAAAGYRALRFNWRFYTEKGERSANLEAEARDLREAIQHLRSRSPTIEHMVLLGKSLGSIVTSRVAGEMQRPAILLTPICRSGEEFEDFYSQINANKRVAMIARDTDPLCKLQVLFGAAQDRWKVAIVEGDHTFTGETEADSDRNLAIAANLVGYWLRAWKP